MGPGRHFGPRIPFAGLQTYSDIVMAWIGGGAHHAKIHLFANDFWPNNATVLADFIEATNPGLTAQPTPAATPVGIDVVDRYDWTFAAVTFTVSGGPYPAAVYGYWIDCDDPVTGQTGLLWFERFPSGIAFNFAGQSYTINPFHSFGMCSNTAGPYTQLPEPTPRIQRRKRGRYGERNPMGEPEGDPSEWDEGDG